MNCRMITRGDSTACWREISDLFLKEVLALLTFDGGTIFQIVPHYQIVSRLRACDCTAVIATASMMSSALQPRERSFAGLSKP
jgi:hypothetical protein